MAATTTKQLNERITKLVERLTKAEARIAKLEETDRKPLYPRG